MSNEDRDWKPSGRPQSTMAKNFSASLNDAFAMDTNLDGLVQSVEQKKQAVSSQSAELEALEARLRETEERLKQKQSGNLTSAATNSSNTNSPHRRQPLGSTFSGQENDRLPQGSNNSPSTAQAPASGSLLSSTMSRWKPGSQDTSPGGQNNARDISAEQLSGQRGGRSSDIISDPTATSIASFQTPSLSSLIMSASLDGSVFHPLSCNQSSKNPQTQPNASKSPNGAANEDLDRRSRENVRAKRAAFALRSPNLNAGALDLDSLAHQSSFETDSATHHSSDDDSSSRDHSTEPSSTSSDTDDDIVSKTLTPHDHRAKAGPSKQSNTHVKHSRNPNSKSKRACTNTLNLEWSATNIYTSGSPHGRKRIGGPNGLPGNCLLM